MAGLLDSTVQVFDAYSRQGRTLVETQKLEQFNEASGGAIKLITKHKDGDFEHQSGWNKLAGLVSNQSLSATVADEVPVALSQYDEKAVSVFHSTKSVSLEESRLKWIRSNARLAGAALGQQVGIGMLKNKLNNVLAAAKSCLTQVSGAYQDNKGTTAAPANQIDAAMLVQARGKMLDHLTEIKTWVMRSEAWTRYTLKNLSSYKELFNYKGVAVFRDVLDTRFIITNDPALTFAHNSLTKYYTLGLVADAAIVYDDGDMVTNIETTNRSLIQTTIKSESKFSLRMRGNSWGTTKYPTLAQMGTDANWTVTSGSSVVDGPGVVLSHQV